MFACFRKHSEDASNKKLARAELKQSRHNLLVLETAVKEAIARHANQKEEIALSTVRDLPEDMQELVRMSNIPMEELEDKQRLRILLIAFHFLLKRKFIFTPPSKKEKEKEKKILVPCPEKYKSKIYLPSIDELIDPEDPRDSLKLAEEVGKGGFGVVYKAKTKKGKRVAVKKSPNLDDAKADNLREIHFLKNIQHPNVVQYFSSHLVNSEMWVVLEFMEGGTLTQAASQFQFQEKHVAYVAKQVLTALSFLHGRNLLHRDLKSPNIMLTIDGEVKLIDFGLCVDLSDGTRPNSLAGSPLWMSPEMIREECYDFKTDIWSFAVCMMELFNKEPPLLIVGALRVSTVP